MHDRSKSALETLIDIAKGNSDQSEIAADFLLAWWNADSCGGFDLTELWRVDSTLHIEFTYVFTYLLQNYRYPDELGYRTDFMEILKRRRPTAPTFSALAVGLSNQLGRRRSTDQPRRQQAMTATDWNYEDPFPDDTPILALFEWGQSGDVDGEYECYSNFTTGFHRVDTDELIATSGGYAAVPVAWRPLPERTCNQCEYRGPFINAGMVCPGCKTTQ